MLIIIIQLETAVYYNENEDLESPLSSFNLLLLKMIKKLTQDVNVTVLHVAEALLDRLVTANVQGKQHQSLPIRISCRLH